MRTSNLLVVALVLGMFPSGAIAAEDGFEVDVPNHRDGDVTATSVSETWVLPIDGEATRIDTSQRFNSTYEVRETGLMWNDTHRILHVDVEFERGDHTFSLPFALDLTTGERVLEWAGFALSFQGVGSFGVLGTVEQHAESEGNLTTVDFTSEPHVRLQQIVGDRVLTTETNLTTVVDHRPRFDLVERYHLNVTGTDEVEDRSTLVADLSAEELDEGVWEDRGLPARVWLADGVPEPVRTVIDVGEPPLSYHLDRRLTSYEAGTDPLTWGQGDPPLRDGPAEPYERAPLDREGPADGRAADEPLPLSEAVFLAETVPTAADFQAWRLEHTDAALVEGVHEVDRTLDGRMYRWTLTFADASGADEVVVERRIPHGAPSGMHVDTVEDGGSTFETEIDPALFDGQTALTIGGLLGLEDAYGRPAHDARSYGFTFFPDQGELGGYLWLDTFHEDVREGPAGGLLEANATTFGRVTYMDAFTGRADLRVPYEFNGSLETHVHPPDLPGQ